MKLILSLIGFSCFVVTTLVSHQAQAQEKSPINTANSLSQAFHQASEAIRPSLVSIHIQFKNSSRPSKPKTESATNTTTTTTKPAPTEELGLPEFKSGGGGTGVIISDDGLVLTNNHVIERADSIRVTLSNKRKRKATIVGKDVKSDIALLKIEGDYEPAAIGNSSQLFVGEWVISAGSPFGLDNSFAVGIVSHLSRELIPGMSEQKFIQTDAAVNMGNSGGPLVNIHGEVVGINTAIFSRTGGNIGLGFAIPINRAMKIVDGIKKQENKGQEG